ncbi:MAG: hypothetical protein HUK14_04650 [Muribaculaceae bacterium]|nr:hypothetical protein [Muribaculaceae bacterium]
MKKFLLFLLALTMCGTANAAWYVVGEFNGWDVENAPAMTDKGNGIFEFQYEGNMPSNFKIVEKQEWSGYQLGAYGDDGYKLIELDVPFNLSSVDARDMGFKDSYSIKNPTLTLDDMLLTLTVTGERVPAWYVAGAFESWDAGNAVEMTDMGEGIFQVEISNLTSGFKLIDRKAWNGNNLGAPSYMDKIELGKPFGLYNDGGSAELAFAGWDSFATATLTLNENTQELTVTGTYSGAPDVLYLPGSWKSDASLWAQNPETIMTKNGTKFTKTYNLTGTSYECKVSGDGWTPQWACYNSKTLSMTNPLVTLDKKNGEYDPGNLSISIDSERPGDYNFTFDLNNYTIELSTNATFTVYVNDPSLMSYAYCNYYTNNSGIGIKGTEISFSTTPETEGDYAGYYKGYIAVPTPLNSGKKTTVLIAGLFEQKEFEEVEGKTHIEKVNGMPVNELFCTLFDEVITEATSKTWVVDLRKNTETLNVIVADKSDASCTLGGTALTEGAQAKTYMPMTEQPLALAIANVPSGKTANVYLNDVLLTGSGDNYSITCNDGDKLYIAFETAGATTETVELDANNIATYCSRHNLLFKDDDEETGNYVCAYKFTGLSEGKFIGERLIGVVPAGTGIYLQGINKIAATGNTMKPAVARADGTFVVNITDAAPTVDVSDNIMKPAYKYETLPATEPFVAPDVDRTVIYMYDAAGKFKNNETEGVSPGNMAYVAVQSSEEHPGAPTTGIETITSDVQPAKALTGIYSITGLRFPDNTDVNSLQPGFYIVNGKKLLVK